MFVNITSKETTSGEQTGRVTSHLLIPKTVGFFLVSSIIINISARQMEEDSVGGGVIGIGTADVTIAYPL